MGHATIAVDAYDDFHIAYLKGDAVMYVSGSFGEFDAPQSVFVGGGVTTAPRIALGLNSALDINIVAARADNPWQLWLIKSEDGMASRDQSMVMSCASVITQYDMAVRHDGEVVVAAYLDSPDNELTVWEERSGLSKGFSATSGMNAGVTLTLDENMHYCVTLADLEGTGTGYILRWYGPIDDYIMEDFTPNANASLTMSQWRTEYGVFISYLTEYDSGGMWTTDSVAFVEGWGTDLYVYSFYDDQAVPVRHSCDPFSADQAVFAYFGDASIYRDLRVKTGPSIE